MMMMLLLFLQQQQKMDVVVLPLVLTLLLVIVVLLRHSNDDDGGCAGAGAGGSTTRSNVMMMTTAFRVVTLLPTPLPHQPRCRSTQIKLLPDQQLLVQSSVSLSSSIVTTAMTVDSSYREADDHSGHEPPPVTVTATVTTNAIITSLQKYIIPRNVTIQSVHWCSCRSNTNTNVRVPSKYSSTGSILPESSTSLLQIYRGASVPPVDGVVVNVTTSSRPIPRRPIIRLQPPPPPQQPPPQLLSRMDSLLVTIKQNKSCESYQHSTSSLHNNLDRASVVDGSSSILKKPNRWLPNPPYTNSNQSHHHHHLASSTPGVTSSSSSSSSSSVLSSYDIMSASLKAKAQLRATQNTIQDIQRRIQIVYIDDHICVVNKPSGILSVPGPRRNPSVCEALYYLLNPNVPYHETNNNRHIDQMVVHRLDMDTSGILIFALSKEALHQLHMDFRQRHVTKVYQALLCHHISKRNHNNEDNNNNNNDTTIGSSIMFLNHEYEINVDLERDPYHPPFMRIAQPQKTKHDPSSASLSEPPPQQQSHSKFLKEDAKPSLTEMHILSYEYILQPPFAKTAVHNKITPLPVTRVQLIPRTGRTHQLRVHTAHVLQHPIVGDDIYGYGGECFCPTHRVVVDFDDDGCHRRGTINDNDNNTITSNQWDVQRQLAELGLPLCLHAQKLYIRHPISGAPMIFECAPHF